MCNDIFFMYQPKYHNEKLFGYEALLREVSNGDVIFPDYLIKENSGNNDFDYFIINSVIDSLSKLTLIDIGSKSISINVSAKFMSTDIELNKINLCIVDEFNLKIEFEILENGNITDYNICNKNIELLNSIGISVSVDDFGSDYASIRRLINLRNINFIKLDKKLIDDIKDCPSLLPSMKILFEFINSFNFKILAEGVENKEIFEMLRSVGIEYFQGFYFSKPQLLDS
ncbi:EAL domain-containing protein [Photobacterium kishitanii]|nr:EAL domain-containing protein [Photobacterium kishitanii]PSV02967.1 EAL domain-containing protein [Photobacterium kishitanii]PSV77447.1 EAL domain-containing protein [Photobacterium kishitanii]PSW50006.1 EAL domain-containing protein [Photobacterium kishitanii]